MAIGHTHSVDTATHKHCTLYLLSTIPTTPPTKSGGQPRDIVPFNAARGMSLVDTSSSHMYLLIHSSVSVLYFFIFITRENVNESTHDCRAGTAATEEPRLSTGHSGGARLNSFHRGHEVAECNLCTQCEPPPP